MVPVLIVAAIVGLPVLIALLFRVSAVFVFLSIAIGNLLAVHLGEDAALVTGIAIKGEQADVISRLVLLALPLILTLFFLRKSMSASKILFNIAPLLACGAMLMVLAMPLLPEPTQTQILISEAGPYLNNTSGIIVGTASLLTLLLSWTTYRHREHHHGLHKKKKHH
jgi:hypothetical protein